MNNIKDPQAYKNKLGQLMDSFYDLLAICSDDSSNIAGNNPVQTERCFDKANAFKRPDEFLQVMLDLNHVIFEPSTWMLGTYFLNSNPSFLFHSIPDKPFQLGYASLISDNGEKFDDFWNDKMISHLKQCNYSISGMEPVYLMVATGSERFKFGVENDLREDIIGAFGQIFGDNLIINPIVDEFNKRTNTEEQKRIYLGLCKDNALDLRLRVSILFYAV